MVGGEDETPVTARAGWIDRHETSLDTGRIMISGILMFLDRPAPVASLSPRDRVLAGPAGGAKL